MFIDGESMLRDLRALEVMGFTPRYEIITDDHGLKTYSLYLNGELTAHGLNFGELCGFLAGFTAGKRTPNPERSVAEAELLARGIVQHLRNREVAMCNHDDLIDHERSVGYLTEAVYRFNRVQS